MTTTISAGASAVVLVPAGDIMTGTGAGLATFGVAGFQALTAGDSWQIGPFDKALSVSISAASAISYAVGDMLSNPSPADGLSADEVARFRASVSGAGKTVYSTVMLGDSITYGDHNGTDKLVGNGLLEYLSIVSRGRIARTHNAGVSGNTTAQMLARFSTDVAAYAPQRFIFMGVVNDEGGGLTLTQSSDNTDAIIKAAAAIGAKTYVLAAPPYNGGVAWIAARRAAQYAVARANGVRYLDPWSGAGLVKPDGTWAVGASLDGTHPTKGALLAAATWLNTQIDQDDTDILLPQHNTDGGLMLNPCFVLGSGGLPTNWSAPGGGSVSTLTTSATGQDWKVDFGAAAGFQSSSQSGIAITGGRKIAMAVDFEISGVVSDGREIFIGLSITVPGGDSFYPINGITQNISGVAYLEAVMPAGATGLTAQVSSYAATAVPGAVTVKRIGLWDITR